MRRVEMLAKPVAKLTAPGSALGESYVDVVESEPMLVEGFPQGTVITRIACGDSISVALTDKGQFYAWETFGFGFRVACNCSPEGAVRLLCRLIRFRENVAVHDQGVCRLIDVLAATSQPYGQNRTRLLRTRLVCSCRSTRRLWRMKAGLEIVTLESVQPPESKSRWVFGYSSRWVFASGTARD